jgi:hypothetical protein
MTQTDTPTFEGTENETDASGEDLAGIDLEVNDDVNLDVDVPSDELDELPTDSATASDGTAAKTASTPRTKAPEGFVKPVEFARLLSAHLGKTVPPQVVYSYVKNNSGESAKNPFPTHEVDGYAWYIKPEEGLEWWDAKNARVATSKAATAAKAAAKAEKATAAPTEAEGTVAPVVEAE